MYAPEGFKAVCYRCSYESDDSRAQRCPVCQFPFILEREATPAGGRRLEDVLRHPSRETGAPPLPGVHAEKRKAQLNAEARARRLSERRTHARAVTEQQRARARAITQEQRAGGTALSAVAAGRAAGRAVGRIGFALLCVSAVAAGALAAVLQHGGL